MSERSVLDDLPILTELGDQLNMGFRRREMRRVSARRVVIAATVAVAGAAGALAWGVAGGTTGSSEASAAPALRAAADAALLQPDTFPKPRQFFYVRWLSSSLVPVRTAADTPLPRAEDSLPKARVTTETWEWWSTTRTGEIESKVLSVTFPTPAARALWQKLGRPPLAGILAPTRIAAEAITIPLDPHVLTLRQVLALPTNPHALYRHLFAGGTAYNAVEDVRQLDIDPIGAKLRAALYRALALVPGIHAAGNARTLTGHLGEAIGANGEELIIDPHTGTMLGWRDVITTADAHAENLTAGTTTYQFTITHRAISNHPPHP